MKVRRLTAKQQMAKIRAHVAKYGITGGECDTENPEHAICPRALVAWASGEGDDMIFNRPQGTAARRVMDALEAVAIERLRDGGHGVVLPIGGGGSNAEEYAMRLEDRHGDTPENITAGLEFIDAAAARL